MREERGDGVYEPNIGACLFKEAETTEIYTGGGPLSLHDALPILGDVMGLLHLRERGGNKHFPVSFSSHSWPRLYENHNTGESLQAGIYKRVKGSLMGTNAPVCLDIEIWN